MAATEPDDLHKGQDRVDALQRQLDRQKRYNVDLMEQNDALCKELARFKNCRIVVEVATQTAAPVDGILGSFGVPVVHGETEWVATARDDGGSVADSVRSFLTSKNSEIERKDYVFNEALGMYYNATTGMMFDGKKFLYYDYGTKLYMYYDEQTKSYKEDLSKTAKKGKPNKKKARKEETVSDADILSSSSSEEGEVDETGSSVTPRPPTITPCVRLMVFRSSCLAPGSLYIATCDRSFTLGRDPKRDIVLAEDAVSKYHAVITFDKDSHEYKLQDFGSQNGTACNNQRLSESKVISEKRLLTHYDVIVIGSTTFVAHIHDNLDTCENCEPGVVGPLWRNNASQVITSVPDLPVKQLHKQGMLELKRKYGLHKDQYVTPSALTTASDDYVDRARVRRVIVGSDPPTSLERDAHSASVLVPISSENKGFQMLTKMGWNEGEGLNQQSINQPITSVIRLNETAGLGADGVGGTVSLDESGKVRQQKEKWVKAAKRYHGQPTTTKQAEKDAASGASQSGNIRWVRGAVTNLSQNNQNGP